MYDTLSEMKVQGDLLEPPGGWAKTSDVRVAPPPPRARSLAFRVASRASALFGRADVPDVFVVLGLNARLFWPWLLFASRLMPFGRLDPRERELAILRTAWRCRSRYEWGQHVEIALRSGATVLDVARVARGADAFEDARTRALVRACDELCDADGIADDTWRTLSGFHDTRALIELTMLIGHYRMLAGFLNSSGIALEPALDAKLADVYAQIAAQTRRGPK